MSAEQQIERLSRYILSKYNGAVTNGGAGDNAIAIIEHQNKQIESLMTHARDAISSYVHANASSFIDIYACCRRACPKTGLLVEGQEWTCSSCGLVWVWDVDEAEGGGWWPKKSGTIAPLCGLLEDAD